MTKKSLELFEMSEIIVQNHEAFELYGVATDCNYLEKVLVDFNDRRRAYQSASMARNVSHFAYPAGVRPKEKHRRYLLDLTQASTMHGNPLIFIVKLTRPSLNFTTTCIYCISVSKQALHLKLSSISRREGWIV